jgi:hypothetical protein
MKNYKVQTFGTCCKNCKYSEYITIFDKANFICGKDKTNKPVKEKDNLTYMSDLWKYIEEHKIENDGICDFYKRKD